MTNRNLVTGLVLGLGLASQAMAEGSKDDAVKGSSMTITGCVATDKESWNMSSRATCGLYVAKLRVSPPS